MWPCVAALTRYQRASRRCIETEAALAKAGEMQERFASWVWEDPARSHRLLDDYNRRFNAVWLRDYTADGERLSLPGMAAGFVPMSHQRAAVARMINEKSVGLFHEVGAGKTAEMVIGAVELKRLGLVQKPVLVVPDHMLEQVTRLSRFPLNFGDGPGDRQAAITGS